jgi:hypothetical protein
MLRNLAWHETDALTRAQLKMVQALGDDISLTTDDHRRALGLNERQWSAWIDFLVDGPLPAEPPLPDMLLRLGSVAFNLSMIGDGSGAAA